MGNSLFANCCRHVTDLIFQTRSSNLPDERSPLLPKPPKSCAVCLEVPEAAQCTGPFPDIIPSEVVTGSLQKCTEYVQDLSKAGGEEGLVMVCDKSCLRPDVGAAGLLQQAEASCVVAVLPSDLGEGPAGLVDHAQSLEACQSCVKLEDSGLADRSCRREEHVAAAGRVDAAPGARPIGQGHIEGQPALGLDTALVGLDSVPKHGGAAPSPGNPGPPSCSLPTAVGKTPQAQNTVLPPPVPTSEVSPTAWDVSAGFIVAGPAAGLSGRSSCDPQVQALSSKQQQKKKRKKKKLMVLGAQQRGTLSCFM